MIHDDLHHILVTEILGRHAPTSIVGVLLDSARGVDFPADPRDWWACGTSLIRVHAILAGSNSMETPPCPADQDYGSFLWARLMENQKRQLLSGIQNRVRLEIEGMFDLAVPILLSTRPDSVPRAFAVEVELLLESFADSVDVHAYADWLGSFRNVVKPQFARILRPSTEEDTKEFLALAAQVSFSPGLSLPVEVAGSQGDARGALTLTEPLGANRFLASLYAAYDPGEISVGTLARRLLRWHRDGKVQTLETNVARIMSATPIPWGKDLR